MSARRRRWLIAGGLLLTGVLITAVLVVRPAAVRAAVPDVPVAPVGWNSWNAYGCTIDESRIERAADSLVSTGMAAAGFRYVVVDDCWVAPARDARGRLRADPTRFPHGIAALARYVHARGLRFGLYTSASTRTCAQSSGTWPGATGSRGREALDAATFAAWGVDLVKDDWCAGSASSGEQRASFTAFRDGILATGRPIALMINPNSGVRDEVPGSDQDWSGIATTVRITNDVTDTWRTAGPATAGQGIAQAVDAAEHAVSRGWNRVIRPDADMLWVGHPGLAPAEQRTQLGMLAFLGLPVMAGVDPARLDATARRSLTDSAVIALTRCAGRPSRRPDRARAHIWVRTCDGRRIVAIFNPTAGPVRVDLRSLRVEGGTNLWTADPARDRALLVQAHDTALLASPRP